MVLCDLNQFHNKVLLEGSISFFHLKGCDNAFIHLFCTYTKKRKNMSLLSLCFTFVGLLINSFMISALRRCKKMVEIVLIVLQFFKK